MIPGVAAAQPVIVAPTPPVPTYGVKFNTASLMLASMQASDSNYFSIAGWFNSGWGGGGLCAMAWGSALSSYWVGFTNTFPYFQPAFGDSSFNQCYANIWNAADRSPAPPIVLDAWQHIIISVDLSSGSPNQIFKCYLDDQDALIPSGDLYQHTSALSIDTNGSPFYFGEDGYSSSYWIGEMYDVSIWPGVSFIASGDIIPEATRRHFIDSAGSPVDPAHTVAELGNPAIFLTGGVSGFLANELGTEGHLVLNTGTLTPSDTDPQ